MRVTQILWLRWSYSSLMILRSLSTIWLLLFTNLLWIINKWMLMSTVQRKQFQAMGNSESTTSDSYDDNLHRDSPYRTSSTDTTYQHPLPVYDRNSMRTKTEAEPSSCAISSMCSSNKKKQKSHYIADHFSSLKEVINALREEGLESSNLILGIDFTKSNEWTGKRSFNRRSLHAIGRTPNPYEQAISIIGQTLSAFDEDNLIPCFGFGDASTHDQYVFSFYSDHRPCRGFEEALKRYREIVPHLKLSGPTSFAPIIDAALDIVESSSGQYHVLVIIADGQVNRSSGLPPGKLSPHEQATISAIVAASEYPLSIVLVGVGDGPWEEMQQFDDNIPQRAFDNFQFVNFTNIMAEHSDMVKKETAFALAALMEIPFQYRATQSLPQKEKNYVHRSRPLPPPREVVDHDYAAPSLNRKPTSESFEAAATAVAATPPLAAQAEQVCPICLTNPKDMAFGCGHLTCKDCGASLSSCPLCRQPITTRIRLYS